jgi:hypothetical protein
VFFVEHFLTFNQASTKTAELRSAPAGGAHDFPSATHPSVILSAAKDLRSLLVFVDSLTTAEILRCAQDDSVCVYRICTVYTAPIPKPFKCEVSMVPSVM